MQSTRKVWIRSALAAAAALALMPAHAVSLKLVDLGTLEGGYTEATALNNLGQVVGQSYIGVLPHAFSWTAGGGMVDLTPSSPYPRVVAAAVNNMGVVALNQRDGIGGASSLWRDGTQMAISPWSGAKEVLVVVQGLNDAGVAVGLYGAGPGWRALDGIHAQPMDAANVTAINASGQMVGEVTDSAGSHGALWSPAGLNPQTIPGMSSATSLNNRGQVAGVDLSSPSSTSIGVVWSASTGAVRIGGLGGIYTWTKGINDAGQVVGRSSTGSASHGFLWTVQGGMRDINSLLSPAVKDVVTDVAAINAWGQMAVNLDGHAGLLSPTGDLLWQGSNGGSFNDGGNWELGFTPSYLVDAQLYTTGIQVVTMASNATVNSLGLGSSSPSDGRPSLVLQDGATLSAAYGVTVRNTGTLTGDGRVAGAVVNQGTVLAYNLRIDGGLTNQGQIVTINGLPGRLTTNLDNQASGEIRISSGQALVLTGERHQNTGVLRLQGGEFEAHGAFANERGGRIFVNGGTLRFGDGLVNRGQLGVSFGGAEIVGPILGLTGGVVALSGRSNTTFYDEVDIAAGSELRVSGDSTAVFFGRVQQRTGALFSGTGTKFYEGGFSVDAAPALGIDEGSIVFGHGNSYLAEIGGTAPGSGFDKLVVGGALKFGGTLKLASWSGFVGQAGQRYDLFDWTSSSGSFDAIDASGLQLADGLTLDTSRLYVDGSVTVTAVPEPGALALMLAGLAAVGGMARRRGMGD